MTSVLQASLTGGEFSPSLYGRVDLARYGISLKTCRNFIVRPFGGVQNRPGTVMIAPVKDSSARVRLIPFQFSSDQTYILEFGNLYLRVYQNGGQVLYPVGSAYGVPGQPVEVSTPYTTAELATLKYTQSADVMTLTHPNHAPQQLARVANDHWTLTAFTFKNGPFQTINVDTNSTVYPDGTTGTVTIKSTSPIFTAAKVGMMFYLEQRDGGTPWEITKGIALGDIRCYNGNYYQAQNPGTTGSLPPTHLADAASDGAVVWLFLHPGFGSAKITAVAGDGLSCTATVLSRLPDGSVVQTTAHPSTTITGISALGDGNIACTAVAHGFTTATIGTVKINYTNATGAHVLTGPFTVSVADADHLEINVTYASLSTPTFVSGTIVVGTTHKWAFGAFGGDQGWPSCVTYHQQRQVFAGTTAQPETGWMSRTGSYPDFGKSTPLQDDDAITFTLAGNQVSAIRSMLPLDRLVLLTSGGVWALGAGQQDVLTPSNLAAKSQGFRSSSNVPPLGIGESGLFIQGKGRIVRDLGYVLADDKYTGQDLTVMANHLVDRSGIVEWAWHDSPHGCVWAVRDDGALLSMTYMREQQVIGWARHDTAGAFESVAVVSEGNEDAAYFAVRRTIGGQTRRFVERMATRLITDIRAAHFVDCGLNYDGRNTTSTTITLSGGTNWDETESISALASAPIFAFPATSDVGDALVFEDADRHYYKLKITGVTSTSAATGTLNRILPTAYRNAPRADWYFARDTFAGLDHLEGQTVNILADGKWPVPQVVIGGKVALASPAFMVSAGLPIVADLEPLNLSIQSSPETVLDKQKVIPSVRLLVSESRGISAGKDFDNLFEAKPRSDEFYDLPPSLISGLVQVPITTNWATDGSFAVRQTAPLPITINALIPDVVIGGAS